MASSRETFPLCLVCDRPWDFILGGKEEEERFLEECCSEEDELQPRNRRQNKARRRNKEEEDAGEDLVAKFQANSKLLKQLDEAVRAKSGQSR